MNRTASARWQGDLKSGAGTVSTQSGVLKETAYSYHTRFEDGAGTNPEELIAAAHAGCFSMALSAILGEENLTPDSVATKATLTMEFIDGAPTITKVHLDVTGKVPGTDAAGFEAAAQKAKANCPISRVLKADISMTATFEV